MQRPQDGLAERSAGARDDSDYRFVIAVFDTPA